MDESCPHRLDTPNLGHQGSVCIIHHHLEFHILIILYLSDMCINNILPSRGGYACITSTNWIKRRWANIPATLGERRNTIHSMTSLRIWRRLGSMITSLDILIIYYIKILFIKKYIINIPYQQWNMKTKRVLDYFQPFI